MSWHQLGTKGRGGIKQNHDRPDIEQTDISRFRKSRKHNRYQVAAVALIYMLGIERRQRTHSWAFPVRCESRKSGMKEQSGSQSSRSIFNRKQS